MNSMQNERVVPQTRMIHILFAALLSSQGDTAWNVFRFSGLTFDSYWICTFFLCIYVLDVFSATRTLSRGITRDVVYRVLLPQHLSFPS